MSSNWVTHETRRRLERNESADKTKTGEAKDMWTRCEPNARQVDEDEGEKIPQGTFNSEIFIFSHSGATTSR